jgi:DNA polymerase IV
MDHRIILHLDMDAFFAAVEVVRDPHLKGKAVIVGGNPERRGVVSTCSYEARQFGVHSAMSLFEAKKRCPHAIFLEGDFSLYREYSNVVMGLLYTYTPLVEVVSIDEAYLDVTAVASEHGGAVSLGQEIRQTIFQKTRLTCSVGIGSNKLIAKIAASRAKPNGFKIIPPGDEAMFLAPLPVQTLPGVGEKTQESLNRDGIQTVADLQEIELDLLMQRYGSHGYYLHLAAFGKDSRPVENEDHPPKSIGAETTFEVDQDDVGLLKTSLEDLFNRSYRRLWRHRMRARGISLKLRFSDFRTITRSLTLDGHTNDREVLLQALFRLFYKSHDGKEALRLIGMSLERLTDSYWQPTFWDSA